MLEARRCARGIDTPRLSSTGKRIAIIAGLRDARGARLNEDRRTRRARIVPGSGSDRAQKMGRPAAPAAAIASAARVGRRSPGAAPEGTGRRLGGIADAGGSRGAASRRDADARDATSCAVPARRAPGAAPNSLMGMGGARPSGARGDAMNETDDAPLHARVRLFLCGDVMTGRGIDQILPHPGAPGYTSAIAVRRATTCGLPSARTANCPRASTARTRGATRSRNSTACGRTCGSSTWKPRSRRAMRAGPTRPSCIGCIRATSAACRARGSIAACSRTIIRSTGDARASPIRSTRCGGPASVPPARAATTRMRRGPPRLASRPGAACSCMRTRPKRAACRRHGRRRRGAAASTIWRICRPGGRRRSASGSPRSAARAISSSCRSIGAATGDSRSATTSTHSRTG